MTDVFISYSRRDRAFVEALHAAMKARGEELWVDWEDIPPTADWLERISNGIRDAKAFVFVVSPDSVASEVCRTEAMRAGELRKRVIGLQVRDVGAAAAPEPVARVNWIPAEGRAIDDVADALVSALATDLEWVDAHTRYLGDAERWDTSGRDDSLLLRGAELRAAERWLTQPGAEQNDPPPAPIHYEFILAGRRGSTRRLRLLAGAALAALAITAVLALLAVTQRNEARNERQTALSRELSAASLLNLDDDPELSLLLGRRAADVRGTDQARDALRQSLLASRVRATLEGHTGGILWMDVSPDGALAATTSVDGTLRIWSLPDGTPVTTIRPHVGELDLVRFSPDGTMVAVACNQATVRVFDPRTGTLVATLDDSARDYRPQVFVWSPDSKLIVQSAFVADARLWDVRSQQPLRDLPDTKFALNFDWSRDGHLLAFAGQDGDAALYDPATGRRVVSLRGHAKGSGVWDIAFSPDQQQVASTASDFGAGGETIVWSLHGASLRRLPNADIVRDLAWSPDGTRLLLGGDDGDARVWNARSGDVTAVLAGHRGPVTAVAWIDDGEVATAGEDETARLWDAQSAAQIAELRGHHGAVRELGVLERGKLLLTASSDGTARLWSTARDPIPRADSPLLETSGTLATSDDDHWLISLDEFDPATPPATAGAVVDLTGRVANRRFSLAAGLLALPAIDGTGTLGVASTAEGADAQPPFDTAGHVVDLRTGREVAQLKGLKGRPIAASFSPDGSLVALGTDNVSKDQTLGTYHPDGQVRIYETRTGRLVGGYEHDRPAAAPFTGSFGTVRSFAWSDDGRLLASGAEDWTIRVFDVRERKLIHTLNLPQPTARMPQGAAVDVSGDGRWVAGAAGFDDKAYVWDTASGRQVAVLAGHASPVESVRFHPDTQLITTASLDQTVRIWDRINGRTVAILRPRRRGHEQERANVSLATFTPDGRSLVLGTDTVDRYTCDICGALPSLVALASRRVTRAFTVAERAAYLHQAP